MLHDPSPHRTSACPVHFLWDGRGKGRALIRAAFLGFLVAGMFFTAGKWLRFEALETAGGVVGLLSLLSWVLGQAFTFAIAREMKRELLAKRGR